MDDFFIPDDIFLYIITWLEPVDCMSLALSGAFRGFAKLYAKKGRWNLFQSCAINPTICLKFFSTRLAAVNTWSVNLSHCFWLSRADLLSCVSNLKCLSELHLTGTKLTLVHLPSVFRHCPTLEKLSVSVSLKKWAQLLVRVMGLDLRRLKFGFFRLKSLRLHFLNGYSPDTWILLLRLLRWCQNCVELFVDLSHATPGCPLEQGELTSSIIEDSRSSLYPDLHWMKNLKILCCTTKGVQSPMDRCLDDLCSWLVNELRPAALEQMWLPALTTFDSSADSQPPLPCFVSRFHLGRRLAPAEMDVRRITHLAGLNLSVGLCLPHLRFVQGYCTSYQELDEFCKYHSHLEHLHIDDECVIRATMEPNAAIFQYQWTLPQLRTLVYATSNPHPVVLKRLTEACPNTVELHIGRRTASSQDIFLKEEPDTAAYLSIGKLKCLEKLNINGVDFARGSFLEQVLGSCRRLKYLSLSGQFEGDVAFHRDLCAHLPLAKNLRDFRLQREDMDESQLAMVLISASCCPNLERLVVHRESWSSASTSRSLTDTLTVLPTKLPRLLALCLVYPIGADEILKVAEHFRTNVHPSRPAFWFHLGYDLPRSEAHCDSFPYVPPIHYDEIVDPADPFFSPEFFIAPVL